MEKLETEFRISWHSSVVTDFAIDIISDPSRELNRICLAPGTASKNLDKTTVSPSCAPFFFILFGVSISCKGLIDDLNFQVS